MNGSKKPTIGVLYSGTIKSVQKQFDEYLVNGLKDIDPDFVEGKKIHLLRPPLCADDKYDDLPKLVQNLISKVDVLVAAGGPVAALVAKDATKDTGKPAVVFTSVADPVASGLVKDPTLPGGNLTGVAGLTSELDGERLGLLYELLGKDSTKQLGALINPKRPIPPSNMPNPGLQKQVLQAAATSLRLQNQLLFGQASVVAEIGPAIHQQLVGIDGLLVAADPFFNSEAPTVTGEVGVNFPAIYQWPEFVQGGGLMSYGPDRNDEYFQAGRFVGLILKGQQPGNLPLYKPSPATFKLVINQSTLNGLGIQIPSAWYSRRDLVWVN